MQHTTSIDQIQLQDSFVTIGSFDGVHRGHQTLIREMVQNAHEQGSPAVVVTFFPHPIVVLKNLHGPFYLTTPEERAELIGSLGVDQVITLQFNHQLAGYTARQFMTLLSDHLGLRELWVGSDFALGRGREGTPQVLGEIGQDLGYTVHTVSPITAAGEKISSSQIRALLAQGDIQEVARQLGRWYSLEAVVTYGDSRGSKLGFPTANLDLAPERLLPLSGVYACRAYIGDAVYQTVTNIGVRPTFESEPVLPRVEAHLIHFQGNLYEEPLRLEFIDFIRPEMRFSSVEMLIQQIQSDIQRTLEVLPNASQTPDLSA